MGMGNHTKREIPRPEFRDPGTAGLRGVPAASLPVTVRRAADKAGGAYGRCRP